MFGYAPQSVTVQVHGVGPFTQKFTRPLVTLAPILGERSVRTSPASFRFRNGELVRSGRGAGPAPGLLDKRYRGVRGRRGRRRGVHGTRERAQALRRDSRRGAGFIPRERHRWHPATFQTEEPPHVRRISEDAVHLRDDLDVRVILIGALSLALVVASPAAASRYGGSPRAEGCAWPPDATALTFGGTVRFENLRGRFTEIMDPRSGRFVRRWDIAGLPESNGSDGKTAWIQDWSGTVHRLDAAHARRVAATDAWFDRRGWCAPRGLGAKSSRAVRREQRGRAFDVVQTVPRGGVPIEMWFDAASGLPDRTIVRLNEVTRVVRFADWRDVDGRVVPFVRQIQYPEDGDVEKLTTETRASQARGRRSSRRRRREMTCAWRASAFDDGSDPHRAAQDPRRRDAERARAVSVRLGHRRSLHPHHRDGPETQLGGARPGFVRLHELRIGDAIVRDGLAHRSSYAFARVERGPLPPKAGWLGLELFARFAAIIDPDARTLTLRPLSERATHYAGVRVPLELRRGRAVRSVPHRPRPGRLHARHGERRCHDRRGPLGARGRIEPALRARSRRR